MELNQLTIKQAQEGLSKKKFSSLELTKACLERIKKIDKKINAFITVCEEEALVEARQADEILVQNNKDIFKEKSLLGIPFSIKDVFLTKNLRTTVASKVLEDFIPQYDATVVKKLKNTGCVILGKTNLDSFCHGSSTETSDFFTTKNPWNLKRLPGGSSGGSAASIVADMTIGSVGTETAGSIRQPVAWCGCVGLKPTYGRVSRYGVIAMASSLDSPGPIVKTVEDAACVFQVLGGKDEFDATTSPKENCVYVKNLKKRIEGIKIGLPREYFLKDAQKGVNQSVKEALKVFEKQGVKVKEISVIDPRYSIAVYTALQRSEVSSNLARYDGIRYGNERWAFNEENKKRIMLGTYTLSSGYYEAYYLHAQKVRSLIIEDFKKAFKEVDIIVAPTSPSVALSLGASKESAMFGELQDLLVEASSIAGLPGLSIPCGFVDNLPVGMQIIGPQFSEKLLLQVGYAYEQATDWHKRKPKIGSSD
ncbi:Asp-tRNA(Asn)/Glu-tRNA(Gln) amidotransferase subunit GatA [Candidatus Microgenomates bacterium]|nr:Asp-tRNA(Asn)/Glu-tRNA(Gln) amidotransferase subunit GatA [Candidatus Microgenomates bacterium]